LVRKIGHPLQPELAVGAIAESETLVKVIDETATTELGVSPSYLDQEIIRQTEEMERRRKLYLMDRPPIDIRNRTAIVVDDGIATGATMRAALRAVRQHAPSLIVLAVPVASPSVLESLRPEADEIVCTFPTEDLGAVGAFYADFQPVEDDVVIDLLARAAATVEKPADIVSSP